MLVYRMSIQYGGLPRDSMCILVATVKIIPTVAPQLIRS